MHAHSRKSCALIILALFFTACNREKAANEEKTTAAPQKAELGQAAPDFTLQDHQGNPVTLSGFKGKIVVLEWINLECPFVQRHYKEGTFKGMAGAYGPQDVAWLAINSTHWAKPSSNKEWHDTYQLPYPILNDSAGRVGRLYGAKTTPHMFIIDKEGRLVYSGAIDDDASGSLGDKRTPYVRQALENLLAGKMPQTPETKSYG